MWAGTEVLLHRVNLHGNAIFAMLICKKMMHTFLGVEKMLLH